MNNTENAIHLKITDGLAVVVGNSKTYVYGGIDMKYSLYAFVDDRDDIGYVMYNGTEESLEGLNVEIITKEDFDIISQNYADYINAKAEASKNPVIMERLEELEKENKVLRENNTNLHKSQADQDELLMQLMLGLGGN